MEYTYWMMGITSRTNFTVSCRLSGPVDETNLRNALRTIQRTHPLLNVLIIPDSRHGAVFTSCSGILLPLTIATLPAPPAPESRLSYDTPLLHYIEAEQQYDFSTDGGPLLRCLLLRHTPQAATLVCTFHHAIADARSAVALICRLLNTYAALAAGRSPDSTLLKDTGPLEQYIPTGYSGFRTLAQFTSHVCRQTLSRVFPRQVHLPVSRNTFPYQRRERFITSIISDSLTDSLRESVRNRACTVHSALCAAKLTALKEEFPTRKSITTWLLSLVDLRSRFDPPVSPDQLGLMISMVETMYTITAATTFWDLARRITVLNGMLLDKGFHFSFFPSLCRIIRATRFLRTTGEHGSRQMLRQGQRTRPPALTVSNIGTVHLSVDSGTLRCEALSYFIPLSSSGLFGSAVNTFNGKLYWNFSYADPAVSRDLALRLAGNSIALLTDAIEAHE